MLSSTIELFILLAPQLWHYAVPLGPFHLTLGLFSALCLCTFFQTCIPMPTSPNPVPTAHLYTLSCHSLKPACSCSSEHPPPLVDPPVCMFDHLPHHARIKWATHLHGPNSTSFTWQAYVGLACGVHLGYLCQALVGVQKKD